MLRLNNFKLWSLLFWGLFILFPEYAFSQKIARNVILEPYDFIIVNKTFVYVDTYFMYKEEDEKNPLKMDFMQSFSYDTIVDLPNSYSKEKNCTPSKTENLTCIEFNLLFLCLFNSFHECQNSIVRKTSAEKLKIYVDLEYDDDESLILMGYKRNLKLSKTVFSGNIYSIKRILKINKISF